MVFMIAGNDTTAITLSWFIYELALNPDVQDKLIAAIDEEIGEVIWSVYLLYFKRKAVFTKSVYAWALFSYHTLSLISRSDIYAFLNNNKIIEI